MISLLIGAYFDWNTVEYKTVGDEVEDNQLWKIYEGNLVSKVSGAVLGVHETEGLTGFVGSNETITPVSVDEAATSSYELLVPGMFHNLLQLILDYLVCVLEKGPWLNGSFYCAAPVSSSNLWKGLVYRYKNFHSC